MREIKFRGKRASDGQWVYGDLTRYSEAKSYITVDVIEQEMYEVDAKTVGQFIGLVDLDKVDIYEGDVVVREWNDGSLVNRIHVRWLYDHNGWSMTPPLLHATKSNAQSGLVAHGFRIVGNVHDDPEWAE